VIQWWGFMKGILITYRVADLNLWSYDRWGSLIQK